MVAAALRDRQPASTSPPGSADVAGERWKPCLTSPSGRTSMHIRVSSRPIAGALDDLSFDAEQAAFSARPPSGKPKPNLADRHPAWGCDFHRSPKNRSTPYSGTRAERSSSRPAFFIAFFIGSKDAARAPMSPFFSASARSTGWFDRSPWKCRLGSAQQADLLALDQLKIDVRAEAGLAGCVDNAVAVDGDVLGEPVFLHRVGQ